LAVGLPLLALALSQELAVIYSNEGLPMRRSIMKMLSNKYGDTQGKRKVWWLVPTHDHDMYVPYITAFSVTVRLRVSLMRRSSCIDKRLGAPDF